MTTELHEENLSGISHVTVGEPGGFMILYFLFEFNALSTSRLCPVFEPYRLP